MNNNQPSVQYVSRLIHEDLFSSPYFQTYFQTVDFFRERESNLNIIFLPACRQVGPKGGDYRMSSRIDTMNGLGEGVWGKPQFHRVNRSEVYDFSAGQALEDYQASGGNKKLPKSNIDSRISQNPTAVGCLSAATDHCQAHDEEANVLKRVEKIAQLLDVKRALPANIFSQADVPKLESRLRQQELDLGIARLNIMETNNQLPLQFQSNHVFGDELLVREMVKQ